METTITMATQILHKLEQEPLVNLTSSIPQLLIATTCITLIALLLILLYVFLKRRSTRLLLEQAGLPTVFWTPRFWNYDEPQQQQQQQSHNNNKTILASTSITRMLPRMERLQGPLGMYGTVYGFNTAVVHVAHPVPAKAILTQTETGASKRPAYNHFDNFCGRGVFTADGDDWRAKRVAVLHALMRGEGSLEERVLQQAHTAANEMVECIQQQKGEAFNVVPVIQQSTIGLIFRYITHQDIPKNVKEAADSKQKQQKEIPSLLQRYLQSVTDIRMIILAQSRSIWFLLPRWCYATFARLYQQEEQTMGPIRQFAHLACHMALPESPLQQLQNGKSHLNGPRSQNTFSQDSISQDLLQETITLLFAGQDTSAATLSWTLHLLSLHPKIQSKLVHEVRSVLDPKTRNPRVTKAMIGRMPYLDAVIKESMRLYPVAPFVVRKLASDIEVPIQKDKTMRLPANSMACLWIYGLHHNPEFWSQPEEFIPERWLDKRDAGIANGAYMPFAVGPRNCLGQPLAQWILRCLLARLMHRFEFEDARALKEDASDRSKWRQDMQAGFTVLPRGGVNVVASSPE